MAENLYKEWFVRFRFPEHENCEFENGIPKGWRIEKIGTVTRLKVGGDAPKEYSKHKTAEYSIPIYSNGIENEGLFGYTNEAIITKNSVTVSARGTIGYAFLRTEPYVPIVRLIAMEPIEKDIDLYYLYLFLDMNTIEGYGTSQQQLTIPFFSRCKILLPNRELQANFTRMVAPIYKEIKLLTLSTQNLIIQRDLLLPRLMSGKLEVSIC